MSLSGRMKAKVEAAMARVSQVLETTRDRPELLDGVEHQYRDKFGMVEAAAHATVAAQVQALAALGLSPQALRQLMYESALPLTPTRAVVGSGSWCSLLVRWLAG